ncbi:single-stranded DNA-binding protein [Candidatus Peregrinibacteria bacterium]|nr:single-stranded DNA-binding protein [Candidatus Peregrinibacteria bacterium]
MFSMNRVHIIGYQTQPVTIRQTPGGTSVTDLNLVVPYSFKAESGEMLEGKGFHTITLWGPMAEVAGKYVRAGSQLFISGRLQTDSWEDEKSGEKRSKTKMVALDMILLDPKTGQIPAPAGKPQHVTSCLNRADIIGHVTRDPEIRTTTSGQQVLTLGVATNERWKDKSSGEDRERTEFHNVVVWGPLAQEVAQYIKKGNRAYASGRVQTRSWETKDGAKRYTTEIIADAVSLLGVKNPIAESSFQTDAVASRPAKRDEEPMEPSVPIGAVPEISYASEIKAEDLPF